MNLLGVGRYFRDPSVPTWRKLVGVAAVLYVLSPVDFIPDVLPLLGWLDDLGAITGAIAFISSDVAKHSERRAGGVQVIDSTATRG